LGPVDSEEFKQWRAAHAEALRLAEDVRQAARVFRRHAGELKYHPESGLEGGVPADLTAAAVRMRSLVTAASAIVGRWDQELIWIRAIDPDSPADELQRGHSAAREALTQLRAAVEVFDRAIAERERASLDAPYGAGAPRRVHPGAQCTWVAERADSLARELSTVTLQKENLLLVAEQNLRIA